MRQNPISRSFFRLVTRLIIGEDDFVGIMGSLAVGHVVAVTSEPSSHHFLLLIRRYIKYFNRHYFGCTLRGGNSFLPLYDWFLFFNTSCVDFKRWIQNWKKIYIVYRYLKKDVFFIFIDIRCYWIKFRNMDRWMISEFLNIFYFLRLINCHSFFSLFILSLFFLSINHMCQLYL